MKTNSLNYQKPIVTQNTIIDPIETSITLSFLENVKWLFLRVVGTRISHLPNNCIYKHLKIQKLVNSLVKEFDIKKRVSVEIDYNSFAPASAGRDHISLSPLFYLDWNALPDHLKISGMDDPKLQKREFYKDFFKYTAQLFKFSTEEINLSDIYCLLVFIQLRSDHQKLYSAIRGMLAHELGHIHDSSNIGTIMDLHYYSYSFSYKWPIISLFINPILKTILFIAEVFYTRSRETYADRFAAEKLKDAAIGAEYGFGSAKKAMRVLKNCRALTLREKILTSLLMPFNEGSILGLLTHGSFSGRINYIEKINKQAFPTS